MVMFTNLYQGQGLLDTKPIDRKEFKYESLIQKRKKNVVLTKVFSSQV